MSHPNRVPEPIISPGDKVICLADDFPRHQREIFNKMPRTKSVYSVRGTTQDPVTGARVLHLVGIYGCPVERDEAEPGFEVTRFRKASKGCHFMQSEKLGLISVPVRVTAEIEELLRGAPLFPQVEGFSTLTDESKLEVVCRRWTSSHKLIKSMSDMHEYIAAGISGGAETTMMVPMSEAGIIDLLQVCKKLGIHQEAWLQGVLGNLAKRFQKMRNSYACRLRNQRPR